MTRRPRPSILRKALTGSGIAALSAFGCTGDTGALDPAAMPAGTGGAGTGGAVGGAPPAGTGGGAGLGGSAGAGASAGAAGSKGGAGAGGSSGAAGAAAAGRGGASGSSGKGGAAGSGGMTAGTSSTGEGGEGNAASTDCADLPICDDFEAYALDTTPNGIWSKQGGGMARVDDSRPHRGEKSVHIVTGESESGRVWLHTTTDRLFPTRHLFGRLWIYLDALPTTEVHWDMIEAQGTADEPEAWDGPFDIALRYGGQLDENFLANFETPGSYSGDGPSTDCAKFSDTRMPFGRWACMEWEFDSDAEVMRFWLDGAAVDDLEVHKQGTQCISDGTDGVWYYPTFESLNLGWREWWEAGTRELWLDDVAVGESRIGCD
jgi:hypothetical protein